MYQLIAKTGLYASAFAITTVPVALSFALLGKSGILFKIEQFLSMIRGDAKKTSIKKEIFDPKLTSVASWNDTDIADKRKNQDVTGSRRENPLPLNLQYLSKLIVDERDLPLLEIFTAAGIVLIPMSYICYKMFLGAPFVVAMLYGLFYQYVRIKYFTLGLEHARHFISHRPLFKSKFLNVLPHIIIDPLNGIPPLVYILHHPIMHHMTNNGKYDISSTEPYQRDSFTAFARYWFKFQVEAYWELPYYAWTAGKKMWCLGTIGMVSAFLLLLTWLSETTSGWATFFVFGLPWFIDHGMECTLNWSNHMFVLPPDAPTPASRYHFNLGNSYNIVDSPFNRKTYNEGYHAIHHAWGHLHWSSIPNKFYEQTKLLQSSQHDVWCIVFRDTSFWKVFLHTATPGKLEDFVMQHFVHIPTVSRPKPPTVAEVANELRRRCAPIDQNAQAEKCKKFART